MQILNRYIMQNKAKMLNKKKKTLNKIYCQM